MYSGALRARGAAEDVEETGQRVGAAPESRRVLGVEQRAVGDDDVEQRVEAVVEEDLGVEDHDQVDPDEHLEHLFVEIEVHRTHGLVIGPAPVEVGVLALAPDGELHFERTVTEPVVVDPILEGLRFLGDVLDDELRHGVVGALEHGLAGREIGVLAEALADRLDPVLRGPAAGDDAHEIGLAHLGHPDVVEDQTDDVVDGLALLVDLDRRDSQSLAEDGLGAGGQRSRQRAAGVHLVAEHARPPDEFAVEEDRDQHQPVVDVGDRPAALVGVAREDHIALFDGVVPGLHHLVDVGAELPDDHPALGVGDHGELVVLLPDDRAHGGSEEHRVHFVASVLERSLDDVEGDGVDLDRRNLGNFDVLHCLTPLSSWG